MQYLDGKTMVTHIIASNLTPKKKIEFNRYRIVKPAWVVDSVQAGKLLPWNSYKVVDEGSSQKVLGFDNGSVISQRKAQSSGYRDQTDTSWYTSQFKTVAESLDGKVGHRIPLEEQAPEMWNPLGLDNKADNEEGRVSSAGNHMESAGAVSPPSLVNSIEAEYDTDPRTILHEEQKSTSLVTDIRPSAPTERDERSPSIARAPSDVIRADLSLDSASKSPVKDGKLTAEEHNAILLADPKVWKSTVVNPGFLKQYYEESRLHHLSHWKAELKSQLQAVAAEKSLSQKAKQRKYLGTRRYILHVDFDCFFAAVSLKKHPEWVDKPTVVAHGGGSGVEIASCNYPARKFGVKNGMWMKTAQQLCPELKILPYDFKAYEQASKDFYEALIDTGGIVQSVSIDEALVDVSVACIEAGGHDAKSYSEGSQYREQAEADEIAHGLRNKIKEKTGCAVSVGIGGNILLAKVALRKAKPAGQHQIKPEEILDFIGALNVKDLPGVAYSIGGKLEEIGVKLVKDIRELTKERLMSHLGPKTGEKIWDYSRGIDRTEVGEQVVRKSVSAEVNWGVRFVTQEQADEFVQCLCDELHNRLANERVKGRQLTMKIMRRSADSPLDPPKHLGHGKCDTFNKSVILGVSTNAKEILGKEAISIMHGWGFPPGELRGIGVQMTKLEPLKGPVEYPLPSSQKRLHFAAPSRPAPKPSEDPIMDDAGSIQAIHPEASHPAAAFSMPKPSNSNSHKPLNTMGTQFLMPTQADPTVFAELPEDIRSRLLPKPKLDILNDQARRSREPPAAVWTKSRSASPTPLADAFPSHSQLDQETLDALPPEVRDEVLGYYRKSPAKPRTQALLPQSPRKVRAIKLPAKKPPGPGRPRKGLLSRGKQANKSDTYSTLTQSNFVANYTRPSNSRTASTDLAAEEISVEFLEALPEDIRQEVLAQQRHHRLQKKGGIDIVAKKKPHLRDLHQPPQPPRIIQLPPKPPKPTFTGRKLSKLPDLREAVSAWYDEFKDDGPYAEDVDALVVYLGRVIGEEKDMAKVVAVVKWFRWMIEEGGGHDSWDRALHTAYDGVQSAVAKRGLGRLVFD